MLISRTVASVILTLASTLVFAADPQQIEQWLERMHTAAHTLNYIGSFVYQQGKQLNVMHITHGVDDEHGERTRLVSQNAIGREVIHDRNRVLIVMPDIHMVMVEKGRPEAEFPPEFPVDIDDLMDTYIFTLGRQERVAGRMAQKIIIKPKDKFRYEHRLWIDTQTGLLLQKKLFDEHNRQIELFLFSEINFPEAIDAALLEPVAESKDYKWNEVNDNVFEEESNGGWTVLNVPAGFYEDVYRHHKLPNSNSSINHLVYTDGLASVSIFIEPLTSKSRKLKGSSRIGAVNAYGRVTEKHHILTVGEVPLTTLKMMNKSVYFDELARGSHD